MPLFCLPNVKLNVITQNYLLVVCIKCFMRHKKIITKEIILCTSTEEKETTLDSIKIHQNLFPFSNKGVENQYVFILF